MFQNQLTFSRKIRSFTAKEMVKTMIKDLKYYKEYASSLSDEKIQKKIIKYTPKHEENIFEAYMNASSLLTKTIEEVYFEFNNRIISIKNKK